MENISLSVKEWAEFVSQDSDNGSNIPIWFQVTGNSMYPFIRAHRDDIMLVSVRQDELKIGDIVLFPGKYVGGDYCLHRLHRIDGDRVQTFGDGNLRPDGWQPKSQLLGKALLIKRGRLTINCESPRWQKVFRLWNALLPLRPLLLLPFRVMNKFHRLFPRIF